MKKLIIGLLLIASSSAQGIGVYLGGSLPVQTPIGTVSLSSGTWVPVNIPAPWGRYALYAAGTLAVFTIAYAIYKAHTSDEKDSSGKKKKTKLKFNELFKFQMPHWRAHYQF